MADRHAIPSTLVALGPVALAMLVAARARRPIRCPPSAEHVETPGRSIASDDTSQAIVLNPANLAFLPAPELRWTWVSARRTP